MKALVYTEPGELECRDEPEPEVSLGEALISVDAVGICGSDLHGYLGHDPRRVPPLILGHEVCGRALSGRHRGRRVALNPLITCGQCSDCVAGHTNLCRERDLLGMGRPGGFAERVAIPERNLVPVPDGLPAAHLALAEPAATAIHSVRLCSERSRRPLESCRALVVGGGAIGILAALELHRQGLRDLHLAEVNALRRQTARQTEVCEVVDPTDPRADRALRVGTFDVVVDAVGSAVTRQLSVAAVRAGGVICHTGLAQATGELDFRRLTLSEVTLVGAYTYTERDFTGAVTALLDRRLGALSWVESRALSDGANAFADLRAGRCAAAKVVLHPA